MSGELLPVAAHREACLALAEPLPEEQVGLLSALGRVLTRDVLAGVDLPGFDNSAMDGFAHRAADGPGPDAEDGAAVRLPLAQDIPAGAAAGPEVPAGQAVRIMTGAPVPDGVDTVTKVEWTDGWTDPVVLHRSAAAGANIRRRGEDVRAGERVLVAGAVLTSRGIGLAAAVGAGQVWVHRRPRVLVLATGDELRPPGSGPLAPGQIYESNGHQLAAAVQAVGGVPVQPGIVPDDEAALLAVLGAHLPEVDLVVTSGGVSAGAFDTVKDVLSRTGTVGFGKVAMQPGMPQGCGRLAVPVDPAGRQVPVITLPGNPVSTFVSFEVFVRPVLRRLAGLEPGEPVIRARAAIDWTSPGGKAQYVRVTTAGPPGEWTVTPVGAQRSHLVGDLARADALAVVPPEVRQVRAGDILDVIALSGLR